MVIIAGSTCGIGHGLAEALLDPGCAMTLSGRGRESTATAVEQLAAKHAPDHVFGHACDLTVPVQVMFLWNPPAGRFGSADIWVYNAGYAGEMGMAWERPIEDLRSVININVVSTILARLDAWITVQGR